MSVIIFQFNFNTNDFYLVKNVLETNLVLTYTDTPLPL